MADKDQGKHAEHTAQDGVGEQDKLTPEAQALTDAIQEQAEQGYRGVKVDPTPNEHYTLTGVTAGRPTPETDRDAAAEAGSPKFRS